MTQGKRGRAGWLVLLVALVGLGWWLGWGAVGGERTDAVAGAAGRVQLAGGRRAMASEPVDLRLALRASVSGKVRDLEGAAVAGARVCALGWGQGLAPGEVAPRCAVSGRDGYYRIDELWPVRHGVHASAPGFIATKYVAEDGGESIDLRPGMERRDVDVALIGGGVEIFGVVRDLSGGAVEGARVHAGGGAVRGEGVALAESGEDGAFSLWVRPGTAQVWASGEGYAEGRDEGAAPGHRFEIFLTPEAVLSGRVLRADDGAPVEGAQVGASRGDASTMSTALGGGWAISDANGLFRVEGLAAGAYKASAGTDELFGSAPEQVVLGVGETSEAIVIPMHAVFVVDAQIVAGGGPACAGGSVMLEDLARERRAFGQVDGDGEVRVQQVLPGDYSVQLRCEGLALAESYAPVRVVDASVEGVRWEVARGQAIAGVVVDAKGRAAAGVRLSAKPEVDPSTPHARGGGGSTDAAGRFVVTGLRPGAYLVNVQDWRGGRAMPAEPIAVRVPEGRDVEGLRIELPATGAVRGTVRDEQGRPWTRVTVKADTTGHGASAQAADDGSFTLPELAPGSYRLVAWRGSEVLRGADEEAGRTVEVQEGATTRVEMVFVAANGVIRGTVRDEHGGALADAFVTARREAEGAAGAATRDRWVSSGDRPRLSEVDGQFTLEGLQPGRYSLLAQRRGGGEAILEHVAIGETVTLTIAPVGRISGRVVLPGGGAPEEFTVRLSEPTSGFSRSDTNFRTGGAWGFAELPAGSYALEVSSADGVKKLTVALAAGETRGDVLIELAGMTRVTGTVVDLEGDPVPGVEVQIRGDRSFRFGNRAGDARNVSDAAGRFEVARAPVGEATLMAWVREGGYESPRMNLQIPAGASFELPPLRMVRQRVARGEVAGDLGYQAAATSEEPRRYVVSSLRAGGAAARAGLQVGDEIVAVDGAPVAGAAGYLYDALTRVSAGTTVQLGLARGAVLAVTATGG